MLPYIIKRIFFALVTLFIIAFLVFLLNSITNRDPVEKIILSVDNAGNLQSRQVLLEQKEFVRKKYGLNLPLFYFSVQSFAEPDTLYKIFDREEREMLRNLTLRSGNWPDISRYYRSLVELDKLLRYRCMKENFLPGNIPPRFNIKRMISIMRSLRSETNDKIIPQKIELILNELRNNNIPDGSAAAAHALENYKSIKRNSTRWKCFIPVIRFYLHNQFHRWLFGDGNWLSGKNSTYTKGAVRGDFGYSIITGKPVSKNIGSKIFWSALLALLSMAVSYSIAIPAGVYSAYTQNSLFDNMLRCVTLLLYSLPVFWTGVILLTLFSDSTARTGYLPVSGVKPMEGYSDGAGILQMICASIPYLVLPLICYSYGTFAYITRMVRASTLEIINKEFIGTARAKGLPERTVIGKHALRNVLLPVVTLSAHLFPMAIGGSVIIETIFSVPGMGNEIIRSVYTGDFPMILSLLLLTGVFTVTGYLVSDLLYAVVDPRISVTK